MKRNHFFLTIILIFFTLAALPAFAEECEHAWEYSNNGESGHTASCSLCGAAHTDAHNLNSEFKPATCLSPAVTNYHCTVCSYTYSFTEGEKNPDHRWSEYAVVRKATCRQAGMQQRTCPDCGQVETAEIPQLEHNYGDWKQYDEKWHIRYCKECDWAYKGSHRLNDGEILVKPTESQLGLVKYTCRVCSDVFQNILRIDGAIYALESEDVLDNGTSYLVATSHDEQNSGELEIALPDGSMIDLRPSAESEYAVYANSKTGNYAGISVQSGETHVDIVPKTDFETVDLEFLDLKKNASAVLRIFNASGAIEITHLDGPRVIIAQHKNADNTIVTLLMRLTDKRDTVECASEIHYSVGSVISIANKNGEYAFTLPEGAKKIASLTFKYHKTSGKITVYPRNHENSAAGTAVHILEGIEFLRSAQNTKTAETYIRLANENGAWRLRATFPSGYTMETPLFYLDGSYAHKPNRYLMDEKALGALMLIDPMTDNHQKTPELQMPDAPALTLVPTATPSPTATPAPTSTPEPEKPDFAPVSASDAAPLPSETVSFSKSDKKAFVSESLPGVVVQFDSMFFFIHQSDEESDINIHQITLVEQGRASFKIQTAYQLPAEFMLSSGTTNVTIKAEVKDAKGKITEISLGAYSISP
ncbi:MAG: hypothetical protein IKJ65_12050 [Clostridia bacterium]|nr:hypothetical protein [Clostridia bacterium]